TVVDGGCYYWTLRSLSGVEVASYLLYDAPDLVEELFERYLTVVVAGIRETSRRVRVDCIGFGEDIAYKAGPLISPAMFRRLILPRYRKAMETAAGCGIQLSWYDSDGDLKPLLEDMLRVGINTVAPCEVAAGMSPGELRRRWGKQIRIIGGIDKREVASGPAAIDREIERNRPLIEEGGFIPAIDHSVSADISFQNYCYFIRQLEKVLAGV
ncbi:MAG TPA: uroporphyrinogen decarboxylase family protein, partial [bacterium]|nr:uroporphyrinogen decarboxylase family protein [bacterium]